MSDVLALLYEESPPGVQQAHNLLTDITVGQLLAAALTLLVIIGIARKINPVMRKLNDMTDDWNGEDARPGVPGRKGVMESIADLKSQVEPITDPKAEGNHQEVLLRLCEINRLVTTNHGDITELRRLLGRHIRESQAWVAAVDKATAERDFVTPPWPDMPDDPHH